MFANTYAHKLMTKSYLPCIIQQIRRHKKSNTCNSLDEFTLSVVDFTKTSPAQFTKWQKQFSFLFQTQDTL